MKDNIRIIATEEHFAPPHNDPSFALKSEQERLETAINLGKEHIATMDPRGIDVRVLSPGTYGRRRLVGKDDIEFCANTNRFLYDIVRHNPGRLEGFAIVPMSDPDSAAAELNHAVKNYGFKGLQLTANVHGKYMDDPKYLPIFDEVNKLGLPIYIHPCPPGKELFDVLYAGNYSDEVATAMSRPGWGWHIEVAVSLMRLVMSGLFDRYPKLQIIVGHMGEAIPFMLPRMNRRLSQDLTKLDRSVPEYYRENVYYTFGGFNYTPCFLNLYSQMGADRIMFSTDYPHDQHVDAVEFLFNLPICPADRNRIAYENAEKLIKIP